MNMRDYEEYLVDMLTQAERNVDNLMFELENLQPLALLTELRPDFLGLSEHAKEQFKDMIVSYLDGANDYEFCVRNHLEKPNILHMLYTLGLYEDDIKDNGDTLFIQLCGVIK